METDPQYDWTMVELSTDDLERMERDLDSAIPGAASSSPGRQSDFEAEQILGRSFAAGSAGATTQAPPLPESSSLPSSFGILEPPPAEQEGIEETAALLQEGKNANPPESVSALAAVVSEAGSRLVRDWETVSHFTITAASSLTASSQAAMAAVASQLGELFLQLVQAVEQARGQVGEAAARASFRIKKSVLRLSKAFEGLPARIQYRPSWAFLAMGTVTGLACVSAGALWVSNRHLAKQVRIRDRELERLAVRLMNLGELLKAFGYVPYSPPAGPVMRYMSSSLIRPCQHAAAGFGRYSICSGTCWPA